jgi:hypothetical protein
VIKIVDYIYRCTSSGWHFYCDYEDIPSINSDVCADCFKKWQEKNEA